MGMNTYFSYGQFEPSVIPFSALAINCPSVFFGIWRTPLQRLHGSLSSRQMTVLSVLTELFSGSRMNDVILGGLSLGSLFAVHGAPILEACLRGPRLTFML